MRNKNIKVRTKKNKGRLVDFKHTNFFIALKKTSHFILYYLPQNSDTHLYWDDLLSILVDDDGLRRDVVSEPRVGHLRRTRLRFSHHGIAHQDHFPSIHILYRHHCACHGNMQVFKLIKGLPRYLVLYHPSV